MVPSPSCPASPPGTTTSMLMATSCSTTTRPRSCKQMRLHHAHAGAVPGDFPDEPKRGFSKGKTPAGNTCSMKYSLPVRTLTQALSSPWLAHTRLARLAAHTLTSAAAVAVGLADATRRAKRLSVAWLGNRGSRRKRQIRRFDWLGCARHQQANRRQEARRQHPRERFGILQHLSHRNEYPRARYPPANNASSTAPHGA